MTFRKGSCAAASYLWENACTVSLSRFVVLVTVFIYLTGLPNASQGRQDANEDKVIFVGSATYQPFQWLDRNGKAVGFVIDLQEAIAHHGGKKAEHRLMAWESAIEAVVNREADVVPLLASEKRDEYLDFTDPFFFVSHAIFSRSGDDIKALDELQGRRVAVVKKSYAAARLAERAEVMDLVYVDTEQDCLLVVERREVDACVEVENTSRRYAVDTAVEQTSAPFWPQQYVFAVRQGDTELLAWLNSELNHLQVEGTFHALYQQWKPELEWHRHSFNDWIKSFFWICLPLLSAVILAMFVSWFLKRQVARRTEQLAVELSVRKKLEDELRYKADYDVLTGLPSRTAFLKSLDNLLSQANEKPPTVIMLELKNLELLTSIFGYHIGHELFLQEFSRRLESMGFSQVSHFGSGVFVAVSTKKIPYETIVNQFSTSMNVNKFNVTPLVIMGISEGRIEGEHVSCSEPEELVRRAMIAYSSAAKSTNAWSVYNSKMEPNPNDMTLMEDFRCFGTRDMFLLYQPKLDLASGYIHEAEALVRWQHPDLGLVPPGQFIQLFEETGLIKKLTYWALDEAIYNIERCRSVDPKFCISVNISARDLVDGFSLVDFISARLSAKHTRSLCLEITETGVIQDYEHAQLVVNALHEANISCAIDDFGTGYASLYYLSKFKVDEVKLDRSFIGNLLNNGRDRAIIASTIKLAHGMGLKVTAEGVEDVATLQALAEMGCDTAQGYLISRPIPVLELYSLMGKRHFIDVLNLPAKEKDIR